MNPQEQREALMRFLAALPDTALNSLSDKRTDIFIGVHEIGAKQGLVLGEMGGICEAVRRVLAGEDSAANLAVFIEKDPNIEEDNRPKIPAIAQELQKQIFDVALPILKQAGMPVKEGKVAYQYTNDTSQRIDTNKKEIPRLADSALPLRKGELRPTLAVSSLQATGYKLQAAPMDERHLRALLRIATGTDYTEEKLRESFEDLPEGLRRAIVSVDTANAVQEIAKKFLLHVDQMGALASETGLVLLGLTHPRDFVKNLAARLRVSETRALEIAREVSGQILVKVRDALRGLHEERKPTAYQYTNGTTIRIDTNKKEEGPVRKLGVLSEQEERKVEPFGGTKVQPLRSQTPYSPEARWKAEEETPTREEVLRGIENPSEVKLKTDNIPAKPPSAVQSGKQPKTIVGPTGWRPPAGQHQSSVGQATDNRQSTTQKSEPEASVPEKLEAGSWKPTASGSSIEQKLSQPTAQKPETRRYTIDPYREPTD